MPVWRYHLGAHKTATTHIQEVLKRQRAALTAKGIDYRPLDELRPATAPLLHSRFLPRSRFLRATASDARSVILSEENWLGYPNEACAFPLYPNLEKRLEIVAKRNSVAFLAIRNPADFAASVYSEAMRFDPDKVSLESTRRAFLENGSPWINLVARLRRIFPELYVWRYEDYRENAAFFISCIAGIKVGVPDIPDPKITQRLPSETIEEMEWLRANGEELPKPSDISPPANPTRFEMFTPEERERLTDAYEREVYVLNAADDLILPKLAAINVNLPAVESV